MKQTIVFCTMLCLSTMSVCAQEAVTDATEQIQDSSYLENGPGYDKAKVLAFFKNWTSAVVNP